MKQSATTNTNLANEAFERYTAVINEIERVRQGIEMNRKGEAQLSEITSDPKNLAERIAREGLPIEQAMERINGVPNFQDILILKKIFRLSECVGRITIKNQYGTSGYGTGFLIAPGVIMTNNHVFPDAETAAQSYIQFNYELNDKGEPLAVQTFNLKPEKLFMTSSYEKTPDNPLSGLDFTVVAVAEKSKQGKRIEDIAFARLDEKQGKITEGENCIVIQHPKGDYKKIVMKDIRMIMCTDDFLIYESDTLPGSSGALVIGMGTGEVVALHHSGVPKKNAQGQWLRKDGGVVQTGDDDDSIDWMGNEGIRVSRLLQCIRAMKLPDNMVDLRNTVLNLQASPMKESDGVPLTNITSPTSINADTMNTVNENNNPVVTQAINILQGADATSGGSGQAQYFEIELSAHPDMQEHWKQNYRALVPGIISSEAVFPLSTVASQRRMFYLTIRSDENPWELAAKLEALPQITVATPDLPMDTDLQNQKNRHGRGEYDALESSNNGIAAWNEDKFILNWKGSPHFADGNNEEMRRWTHKAVRMMDEQLWAKGKGNSKWLNNLSKIRLVQLDTGYTDHSKVASGFDLDNDEDFIDGDDARDEMSSGVLQHPGHGTRTASLIIGGAIKNSPFKADGNIGLLRSKDLELDEILGKIKVIPYRIAQSVVLINRGKNLVDAVNHSINSNADVMFMCMGSYPRPMIYEAAKAAYDMGVIWICAAGNEVEMVIAPALYPGTIAVAASNPHDYPWKGSCYGQVVDIAAPGEDVYVPFVNKKFEDIMVYGSGTSYATPHVAAAAVLWKTKYYDQLKDYIYPWQIVEAFRFCLKQSARTPNAWQSESYGAGILDVNGLLNYPVPQIINNELTGILFKKDDQNNVKEEHVPIKYAYEGKAAHPEWDLGIRETAHHLWKTLVRKLTTSLESTSPEMGLTERARISISALTAKPASNVFESYTQKGQEDAEKILNMYFDSFK
ncbi:MAG TPA: S8 family serine peptidase [Flavipsychrobacter sp.]|nr:S8 family serine peptidase [Flavipsychrobacter sp.]